MRILLIGNYALGDQKSMLRYAEMLRREMSQRGYQTQIIQPPVLFGRFAGGPLSSLRKWLGYLDMYLLFPPLLCWRARRVDVAHICDHSNSMYLPWLPKEHRSITCHDLLAIQSAEGKFSGREISATGKLQQQWIKKHLLKAERVICVSTATANELRAMGASGDLHVILSPVHSRFEPSSAQETSNAKSLVGLEEDQKYFIHVGSNTWYKNREGVLKIMAALQSKKGFEEMRLVMVGAPWTSEMRSIAAESGLEGRAIESTGLNDDSLRALYSGAEALLFPSLYEGFGWPVLEAQSCNCLVITSNREPMTEVAGQAAIFIDPMDAASAADTIAARWPEREALREAGKINAERFSPEKVFSRYEAFFASER